MLSVIDSSRISRLTQCLDKLLSFNLFHKQLWEQFLHQCCRHPPDEAINPVSPTKPGWLGYECKSQKKQYDPQDEHTLNSGFAYLHITSREPYCRKIPPAWIPPPSTPTGRPAIVGRNKAAHQKSLYKSWTEELFSRVSGSFYKPLRIPFCRLPYMFCFARCYFAFKTQVENAFWASSSTVSMASRCNATKFEVVVCSNLRGRGRSMSSFFFTVAGPAVKK